MQPFRCPSCDQATIPARRKWSSSSFAPVVCPNCEAKVYASGKQSAAWRMAEGVMIVLVLWLMLVSGAWALLLVIALIVIAMETLRLFLVPLVQLQRTGGGFR